MHHLPHHSPLILCTLRRIHRVRWARLSTMQAPVQHFSIIPLTNPRSDPSTSARQLLSLIKNAAAFYWIFLLPCSSKPTSSPHSIPTCPPKHATMSTQKRLKDCFKGPGKKPSSCTPIGSSKGAPQQITHLRRSLSDALLYFWQPCVRLPSAPKSKPPLLQVNEKMSVIVDVKKDHQNWVTQVAND